MAARSRVLGAFRVLFSTLEFIFLFLPVAVTLHFLAARHSPSAAIVVTFASSLFFYAWWNPPYIALLLGSILVNYALATRIVAAQPTSAWWLASCGIVANLSVLAYYKYWEFLVGLFRGIETRSADIPLALSFTTFVQVAFLVYVYRERRRPEFRAYSLFVSYFPHLIAGPLVRWPQLGPQIANPANYRPNWDNIALGLTIFVLGLSKKLIVADELAQFVAPVFDAASRGDPVTAAAAWGGAFAFSAQLYFDFSGYSDMAVGLGLLFNYRLPVNFATPFRAGSIIDLWRRWHITLSEFLRDFIYIPLGGSRFGPVRQYLALFVTMVLGGLWHGAGLTFIAWGAFHGALLAINHAWRRLWGGQPPTFTLYRVACWALTLTAFAIGMVYFRAATFGAATHLLSAMFGLADVPAASKFAVTFDSWSIRHGYLNGDLILAWFGSYWSVVGTLWTVGALALAVLAPDTMEMTNYREGIEKLPERRWPSIVRWRPSAPRLVLVFGLFGCCFLLANRVREFLYYQF